MVLTHSNLVQALFCIMPTAFGCVDPVTSEVGLLLLLGLFLLLPLQDCYIALLPLAHVLELLAENLMLVRFNVLGKLLDLYLR